MRKFQNYERHQAPGKEALQTSTPAYDGTACMRPALPPKASGESKMKYENQMSEGAGEQPRQRGLEW